MKTTFRWLTTTVAVLHGVAHASTILFAAGYSDASSQSSAEAYRAQVTQDLSLPGSLSAIVPAFNGLSSHGTLSGPSGSLAYSYTVTFDVAANQAGNWGIRVGGDFGKGAAVFLDGVAIGSRNTDMWWDQQYDASPTQTQSFQLHDIAVTAGTHTLQVFGLENCCDGDAQAQFSINNGPYTTFSNVDGLGAGQPRFAVPMDDMETIGMFSSWANLNTNYPKLAGEVDDTARLQRALDDLGHAETPIDPVNHPEGPFKPAVLYLPAGTYAISSTLNLRAGAPQKWAGVSIIGEHPSNTIIEWHGLAGGAMLVENGGYNNRYSRIQWDGKGTAGYGVAHWYNTASGVIDGFGAEHTDEIFQNMEIGIMAGRIGTGYGSLNSEGQVRRVSFKNITKACMNTGSPNALNWWVWDSHFEQCARGAGNIFSVNDTGQTQADSNGGGNVHVYRSVFEKSGIADVNIKTVQWFSMHNNVSIGSARFFQAENNGHNASAAIIQNNVIVDDAGSNPANAAIWNTNLGPVIMIDNQIRSPNGVTLPQVRMDDWVDGRDAVTIGNRYTAPTLVQIITPQTSDRWVSDGDTTVSRSQIATPSVNLPATPAWSTRSVFEPSDLTGSAIQAAIMAAIASGTANPIVHLPPGNYDVYQTITVPARARLQVAGDGVSSKLRWRGSASSTMFDLQGPSYATLRDMQIVNWNDQNTSVSWAVRISGADQPGGRIYIQGSKSGMVDAASLSQTSLVLIANPEIGHEWDEKGLTLADTKSVISIGSGHLSSVTSSNSNVLLSDSWYEGKELALFRPTSGNFTYLGGHIAPCDINHPCGLSAPFAPAILLDNFVGNASFIGLEFNVKTLLTSNQPTVGIQIGTETSSTNAMFLGMRTNEYGLFSRSQPSGSGSIGLVVPKDPLTAGGSGNSQAPSQGLSTGTFISSSLQQARSLKWDTEPYSPPAGATDVRIYRIKADQSNGITISGN